MREEVHAYEGKCDVGHHEPPREIPEETQVEAKRQPSVGVDGSAVICTQVVVDPFLASRNEPAGVHTEVGTRVDQESPFTDFVRDEEAARGCGADMCRR
jgi:hypothetical protein